MCSCNQQAPAGAPTQTSGPLVAYASGPLDSRAIGPLVKNYAVTLLLATPTFLQLYHARLPAGGFRQPAVW